jgi:hypothetical protein
MSVAPYGRPQPVVEFEEDDNAKWAVAIASTFQNHHDRLADVESRSEMNRLMTLENADMVRLLNSRQVNSIQELVGHARDTFQSHAFQINKVHEDVFASHDTLVQRLNGFSEDVQSRLYQLCSQSQSIAQVAATETAALQHRLYNLESMFGRRPLNDILDSAKKRTLTEVNDTVGAELTRQSRHHHNEMEHVADFHKRATDRFESLERTADQTRRDLTDAINREVESKGRKTRDEIDALSRSLDSQSALLRQFSEESRRRDEEQTRRADDFKAEMRSMVTAMQTRFEQRFNGIDTRVNDIERNGAQHHQHEWSKITDAVAALQGMITAMSAEMQSMRAQLNARQSVSPPPTAPFHAHTADNSQHHSAPKNGSTNRTSRSMTVKSSCIEDFPWLTTDDEQARFYEINETVCDRTTLNEVLKTQSYYANISTHDPAVVLCEAPVKIASMPVEYRFPYSGEGKSVLAPFITKVAEIFCTLMTSPVDCAAARTTLATRVIANPTAPDFATAPVQVIAEWRAALQEPASAQKLLRLIARARAARSANSFPIFQKEADSGIYPDAPHGDPKVHVVISLNL